MSDLDKLERQIIEQIEIIKRDYERQIAPLVERLVQIQNLRLRKYIICIATQLKDLPPGTYIVDGEAAEELNRQILANIERNSK